MAKHRNGQINKSQAIRDYITANPGASAQQVVEAMSAAGIRVAIGLVYMVKSKKPKRRTTPASAPAATKPEKPGGDPIGYLLRVKALADEGGGVAKLKQLVDAMAE